MIAQGRVLFDFTDPAASAAWQPISDVVMGGLSTATLSPTDKGTAVFMGTVSVENNGGFASIRSVPGDFDLSCFRGLTLAVRGDGRQYKINLKTNARFDGVLYRTTFDTTREWQAINLRFSDFVPTLRGRHVPTAPPLDLEQVRSIGLMVSDRPGDFRLEIRSIQATA